MDKHVFKYLTEFRLFCSTQVWNDTRMTEYSFRPWGKLSISTIINNRKPVLEKKKKIVTLLQINMYYLR